MSATVVFLMVAAGFGLGVLLSWLLVRARWAVRYGVLEAEFHGLQRRLEEQGRFFAESSSTLKETFGALAADALHRNNQAFVVLAESRLSEKVTEAKAVLSDKVTEAKAVLDGKEKALDGLVGPLKESLDRMDTKINALESKREGAYSHISTLLESMQKSAAALDKGTQHLISALKSSSSRGRYGEIGLRRVVEFAGMTEHCDFSEQASVSGEEGVLRPDMIIRLPEKKTIVVDSKTPLDAYMKAFETENEAERQAFLAQHARAVKDHLRKLSAKNYWTQFPESPDYVVLYMQIESSFAAALQADPSLIEDGILNKVILATPTTLITLLRTIGFVWQQRNVADNIEQIRDAGIELYNRTTTLLRHFGSIGSNLKAAVGNFNNAVSSLESRFIPQARRLHAFGSAYTQHVIPDIQQVEIAVREFEVPEEESDKSPLP
jgi:DNA recombination protein RmuC